MKRIAFAIAATLGVFLAGTHAATAGVEGYTWAHTAKHWPIVYVQNTTDGKWAVSAAVTAWGSGLRNGKCRTGAGCITITSPTRGNAAPLGQSFIYAPSTTITKVDITMNASDEAQPLAVRTVATEHELGHALGLAHDTSWHGIMNPCAWGYNYINSHARNELATIYGM